MREALVALLSLSLACGGAPAARPAPSRDAGWTRLQDLLDRFDRARFQPDAAARRSLLADLHVADAGPGAATTDAALDALLVEVDRLLAADRLHAGAQAARTLLEFDRRPPGDRRQLLAATRALKNVARGGGSLAPNATLRLYGICDRAFRDLAETPPRQRPLVLATCLYPLHDADPEPYFEPDPARRPPPPSWEELDRRLAELAATLETSRFAAAGAALERAHAARVAEDAKRGLVPQALDPRALGVPLVDEAVEPYDWQPLVVVKDPSKEELARFETDLRALLDADGGGRVAAAVRADAPARHLLQIAALARRLRAERIDLVVGYPQVVHAPAGDYWHDRAADGRVPRAGVLPLALTRAGARSPLGLRLTVAPRAWQLVSPAGSMPAVAVADDAAAARAALRAQLDQLLDAFPDEDALAITPDPEVTVAALAAAVLAVPRGVALALDESKAPAGAGDLAARAARRAAARVTVTPDALAPRAAAVRRCWQDAVERKVAKGALSFELSGKTVKPVAGPADETLRRCVAARLEEAMVAGGITSARVDLE